jgi:hypothetical protein
VAISPKNALCVNPFAQHNWRKCVKWCGADDDTLSVHRTVGKGKNSVLLNGTEGLDTILAKPKARTEYLLGVLVLLDNWTEMVPFR